MSVGRYSGYEFEVYAEPFRNNKNAVMYDADGFKIYVFCYRIFTEGCPPYDDGVIESDEWFETDQEARFAAIGHIGLLENGEG